MRHPLKNQDEQPDGRQPETDEREIPHENEEDLGTQPGERRSPARNHQRSSQTHRARTRTYPDGGNTTNRSREEGTEREEASVTSRRSRTHSRSTRRGESTQRANDRESMGTSKSGSHSQTKSMSKTRSASNYSQLDLREHLNRKKPDLRQQLGPKQEDPIQLQINELEDKFRRYQVGELGKLSGYDIGEILSLYIECLLKVVLSYFV
ncbi:uncharacterized protein LOC133031746 [Cannabis sativa]|uniref:uncharacterized protein LOC133031746 n=1 Tax=Cannabis sativa TaxID=3483 RepID=UPI0029C9FBD1|nr:uncharacterized protein LOC133031746 [Cannabis sativa]XP_060961347.1 uncharacterized protein LOC133031746 [Cannabis sativa]